MYSIFKLITYRGVAVPLTEDLSVVDLNFATHPVLSLEEYKRPLVLPSGHSGYTYETWLRPYIVMDTTTEIPYAIQLSLTASNASLYDSVIKYFVGMSASFAQPTNKASEIATLPLSELSNSPLVIPVEKINGVYTGNFVVLQLQYSTTKGTFTPLNINQTFKIDILTYVGG